VPERRPPLLIDPSLIRRVLERDRPWAVYALGDLSPGYAEHCRWLVSPDEPRALVLLYARFEPPILFAMGPPQRLKALMGEVDPPVVSLHVRAEALPVVRARYPRAEIRPMWRMVVDAGTFRPAAADGVSPLAAADVDSITRLYAEGRRRGEGPDYFDPSMVEPGIFRGVFEGDELVAVAGTHLVVPSEGVGAVGNVYTRHDRRGRGLGGRVTSAVVEAALARGAGTVVLNVDPGNAAAVRVYQRLGFRLYCDFLQGLAFRAQGGGKRRSSVAGRHVALVRGINVGRARRVAMADLRDLLADLGYRDVRTLLNSGNAVFGAEKGQPGRIGQRIEQAMAERLGVSAAVTVLAARDFSTVVEENPLASSERNPARLLVAFCDDASRLAPVRALARQRWRPEALAVGTRAAYLWCAGGILESPLLEAVGRAMGQRTTTRNWATVLKIQAALQGSGQ
jgi:uncharacterized protein (DUF1697 family)/GNAT superfamily N-acetyltransferase